MATKLSTFSTRLPPKAIEDYRRWIDETGYLMYRGIMAGMRLTQNAPETLLKSAMRDSPLGIQAWFRKAEAAIARVELEDAVERAGKESGKRPSARTRKGT